MTRAEAMAAVRARPDDPTAWVKLGELLLEEGEPERARECYGRALALDPRYPGAQELFHTLSAPHLPPPSGRYLELLYNEEELSPPRPPYWFDGEATYTLEELIQLEQRQAMRRLALLVGLPLFYCFGVWLHVSGPFPLNYLPRLVAGALVIGLGLHLLQVTYHLAVFMLRNRHWPSTTATIEDSTIFRHRYKNSDLYLLIVFCSHTIDGKTYRSFLPSLHPWLEKMDRKVRTLIAPSGIAGFSGVLAQSGNYNKILALQEPYQVGQSITIFYDPSAPQYVTHKRGFSLQLSILLLIYGLIGSGLLVLIPFYLLTT